MARNRVPKPKGWKGGSDDFTILSTGYAGHLGLDKYDDDTSLDELRNRRNCKPAGSSWDDYDPEC